MNTTERHDWSKNDMILAFYYTLYGLDNIGITDYEFAEIHIGASLDSLLLQAANIRYYYKHMGYDWDFKTTCLLSDYYALQVEVIEEYKDLSESQLEDIVENILVSYIPNIEYNKKIAEQRMKEKKRKESINKEVEKLQKNYKKTVLNFEKTKKANMRMPASLLHIADKKLKEDEEEINYAKLELEKFIGSL
jgi:hypothetical protein